MIDLSEGETGWVFDGAGNISGNIAVVPLVDPPLLPDGSELPTGPAWNPIPNQPCATETEIVVDDEEVVVAPVVSTRPVLASGWKEPINLSRSGANTAPFIIVDSEKRIHVSWQSAGAEFVYTWAHSSDLDNWSPPRRGHLSV